MDWADRHFEEETDSEVEGAGDGYRLSSVMSDF